MRKKITIVKEVEGAMGALDKDVSSALQRTERIIEPVRESVFRRFPTLFLFLVTFGVVATFYGFEAIITKLPYLADRPWLILTTGVTILWLTGTLYKKLG